MFYKLYLTFQETERQVFNEQGLAVDGRVYLLELANTELEAKYTQTHTTHIKVNLCLCYI